MINIKYKHNVNTNKPCVECGEMLEIAFKTKSRYLDLSMKRDDSMHEVFVCKKCGKKYMLNIKFNLSLKPILEEDSW